MNIQASFHQERLWFINEFESGTLYESSPIYHNIPLILDIKGPLNIHFLERSILDVIHRHEVLRTRIISIDDNIIQHISKKIDFKLSLMDLTDERDYNRGDNVVTLAIKEAERPFLLDKDTLIRCKLIKLGEQEFTLIITIHHIIADKYSLAIFIRDVFLYYEAYLKNSPPVLSELSLHYADFSCWQREFPPKVLKPLLIYWKKRLKGKLQALELPTDRSRASIHTYKSARRSFTISKHTSDKIKYFSKEEQITNFITLLAVFKVLVHRYSGLNEIVVGTSCLNRDFPGTEDIMGPLANLLVLRTKLTETDTFRKIFSNLKRIVREAYKYQSMPFDKLVQELHPGMDMSRTALFDVLFQYEETGISRHIPKIKNLEINVIETNLGWGKYDLNILIQEGESFKGILVYNSEYYNDSTISRLIGHYKVLLGNIVADPDRLFVKVSLLTEQEKTQLLYDFNQTQADYPCDKMIHHIFEEQVADRPHRTALEFENCQLTYAELDRHSNNVAFYLRNRYHIQPNSLIGIMLERSQRMIIGLLGILKAGGAYVPIEPHYPGERIHYILNDSKCELFITDGTVRDKIDKKYHGSKIDIFSFPKENNGEGFKAIINANGSEDIAYIIYTSGTTGYPKGCMVSHRNVVRLLINDKQLFDFSEHDTWIMAHSFCFDFSVWEMYGALLYGGKLIVPGWNDVRDLSVFISILKKHKVSVLNQTPMSFYNLIEKEKTSEEKTFGKQLRYVIFGGDRLNLKNLRDWIEFYSLENIQLINMFGITETTVHVTFYRIKNEDIFAGGNISPIGSALPETTLYIFDKNLEPVPIGIIGELFVGGSGVSKGYLNRIDLTAERFIKNPYRKGERIYKTGDLGKWTENGMIEYMGRNDDQVKIRGYRIELGEIENRLRKINGVNEVVIVAREDKEGEKYICAYITGAKKFSFNELKRQLSRELPRYMVPMTITQVEKLPLTSSGKLDRNALPESENENETQYISPTNPVEEKLTELWAEILGKKKEVISIDTSFFELGGHSLRATRLSSLIHRVFNVKVPLAEIFKAPTIRELAVYVKNCQEDEYISLHPTENKEYYVLSSAQKRIYILQQMELESTAYNVPGVFIFEEDPDIERFEKAFGMLIRRHESLRTSFRMVKGLPVQVVHREVDFSIEYFDPGLLINSEVEDSGERVDSSSVLDNIIKTFIRPFNLSKAPLLRVGLVKNEQGKHIMMIDTHHIITDGVSNEVLVMDFMSLYIIGEQLPELRLQYKDYSEWQNFQKGSEVIHHQEKYWLTQFKGEIPVLRLPTDYTRPLVQSFAGSNLNFDIDETETNALREIALSEGATLYMVLLSIYYVLLHKLSGQEDIVIGTPTAGRRHTDLQQIIGVFINTLALRNFPLEKKTFKNFLIEVKERTLEAFENQEYQYEDLVENVSVNRDVSRNPLFDVMFMFQNIDKRSGYIPQEGIPGLKLKPYEKQNNTSKFDMILSAGEIGDRLFLSFKYCTRLFKKETIARFIRYFKKVFISIITNPACKISDIEILSGEDKSYIIYRFNETGVEYPREKTIIQLFEEHYRKTPDGVALIGSRSQPGHSKGQNRLTYDQLNKQTDRMAGVLRAKGVKTNSIVGLITDRSIEMIVGMFAAWKIGCAYLPIGPEYPAARVGYMLRDCNIEIVLTDKNELLRQPDTGLIEFLNISDLKSKGEIDEPGEKKGSPTDPAYVIYTSGSTGAPRGVIIENKNVVNFMTGITEQISFSKRDTILSLTTLSFDIFGLEAIIPLTRGSKVFIGNREEQLDTRAAASIIRRECVTIFQLTPSHLQLYISDHESAQALEMLEYLLIGGEPFPLVLLKEVKKVSGARIYNLYGPTETTIWSTVKDVTGEKRIDIGKPLANTQIYILDRSGHPQPIGVAGELCISGEGVGRGYLNHPELTAERFGRTVISHSSLVIENFKRDVNSHLSLVISPSKFFPNDQCPMTNDRLYRTGDLAKWLPDGNIEFLGRMDHQVKIRGFRIELGEIEVQLQSHDKVKEAAVIVKGDEEKKYLTAYIVVKRNFSLSELRSYLSGKLPEYMIPSQFVLLEQIPLNQNGKLDRKALARYQGTILKSGTAFVPPRLKYEKIIAAFWKEILNLETVGIHDNFFELGGNSLNIIQLNSRLKDFFKKDIPVVSMFTHPTIKYLVDYLSDDESKEGLSEEENHWFKSMQTNKNKMRNQRKKRIEIVQNT